MDNGHLEAEPTDEELDQLELFLDEAEPNPGIPLSAVDGLLAAIACGPDLVKPSEWIPAIFNGKPPEFGDKKEADHLLGILMKLYNSVVREVNAGSYGPMLDVYEGDDGEEWEDPLDWCRGFVEGCTLREKMWEIRRKIDPELNELLAPILRLADPTEHDLGALASPKSRELILSRLSESVIDLRDYWREKATDKEE